MNRRSFLRFLAVVPFVAPLVPKMVEAATLSDAALPVFIEAPRSLNAVMAVLGGDTAATNPAAAFEETNP